MEDVGPTPWSSSAQVSEGGGWGRGGWVGKGLSFPITCIRAHLVLIELCVYFV